MLTTDIENSKQSNPTATENTYGYHVRYDEIGLKGENRKFFERRLISNIKEKLTEIEGLSYEVIREYGRILISLSEAPSENNLEKINFKLENIFGVSSFSPIRILPIGSDLELIKKTAIELTEERLGKIIEDSKKAKESSSQHKNSDRDSEKSPQTDLSEKTTFAVRAKRIIKNYPLKTREIEMEVGSHIGETYPEFKVDLTHPDIRIGVEVRQEGIFLYSESYKGPGGLPVKTLGKVLSLLSGGIDSPVASYLSMKRGCRTYFLYFDSFPYTSKEAQEKVFDLHRQLNEYQPKAPLFMVNLATLQKEVRDHCNERFRTLLYRAIMMKIATKLAHELECLGIVTGEAIGQVASQTLENLNVTDSFTDLVVVRPVSNMDKKEIIKVSQKIGTYNTSIIPHSDCCTVFQPERPATRGRLEQIEKELKKIPNLDELIDSALNSKETFLS
jgi:thiamine biosynthesis protein ThiI